MSDTPQAARPPGGLRPQLPVNAATRAPYSGRAIASFALGITGVLTMGLTVLFGLPLGHLALRDTRPAQHDAGLESEMDRRARPRRGRWMAVVGVIAGWLCVAMWALFGLSYLFDPAP